MKIKGSSKSPYASLVALFGILVMSKEIINVFGNQVLIYLIVFIALMFFAELYFASKESITFDSSILYFDLEKYSGHISVDDIQSIDLKDNINDLVIRTSNSTHIYKLYGFRRKKIELFLESLNTKITETI